MDCKGGCGGAQLKSVASFLCQNACNRRGGRVEPFTISSAAPGGSRLGQHSHIGRDPPGDGGLFVGGGSIPWLSQERIGPYVWRDIGDSELVVFYGSWSAAGRPGGVPGDPPVKEAGRLVHPPGEPWA